MEIEDITAVEEEDEEEKEDTDETEESETEETEDPKSEEKPTAKKDEELDNAISKLKQEIAEKAEDTQLVVIGSNLLSDFKKDPELAKAYTANKQSLENIWEAVKEKVKEEYAKGGFAMLPDEQVYAMAREQCHLPPKPKKEPKQAEETKTGKPSKAEKKASEETPSNEASEIMKKATKVAEKKPVKKQEEYGTSLFDALGIEDDSKKA